MRNAVTLLVILTLLTAPVTAETVDPTFETTVPEPVVVPGQTQQLTIQLANDAGPDDRAETATDVRVSVAGDGPIDVLSGPRRLGSMSDETVRPFTVTLDVPANVPSGTYELPVTVSYVHDGERKTQTVYATVRVRDRAYFRVESTSSSTPVGGTGTISVTITNVGNEAATNAAVSLTSTHSDVTFGRSAAASRFVGRWEPNETVTLTYDASVAETADTRAYTLLARVNYDTPGGDVRQSAPLRVGIVPLPEQSFAVRNVTSTLRVGDEGEVTGTLVNTGNRTVRNVVLTFHPGSPNVDAVETEVALGTLRPGEQKRFSFEAAVSESAGAGPRQFTLGVRYRNQAGNQMTGDPIDVRVRIRPERPTFGLSPISATFTAGAAGTLRLELTNRGEKRLTDVSAKLYADSPLSSSDDEAFVQSLEPGETVTVEFGFAVAGDALSKTYPVKLDFRYDLPSGETRISDTYQVPVEVTESETGGLPLPAIGVAVALLLVLGGAIYAVRR